MLTPEEDVEIASLRKRGWLISAVARHAGGNRKTVSACLCGERKPGVRARSRPDSFDWFEPYVGQRLVDDPHVRAAVLFDEVTAVGFERGCQAFAGQVRDRQLRLRCERCASSAGRTHADVGHRPGGV